MTWTWYGANTALTLSENKYNISILTFYHIGDVCVMLPKLAFYININTIIFFGQKKKTKKRRKKRNALLSVKRSVAVKVFWKNTTRNEMEVWRFFQKPVGLDLY